MVFSKSRKKQGKKGVRALSQTVNTVVLLTIGFVAWAFMYQVGAGVLSREEGNTLVCMNSQEYYVNSGEVMVISITVTDQGYKPFLFHPNNLVVEEPGPGNGILYAYGNPSFSFYVVSQGGSNPPKRWSDGHCTTGWFVHYVGHSPVQ